MTTAIDTTELGPAGLLIAKGWTQNEFARNANGTGVVGNSEEAVCWCSIGALFASYNFMDFHIAKKTLSAAVGTEHATIDLWNDDPARTHAEVIEAFRKAGV